MGRKKATKKDQPIVDFANEMKQEIEVGATWKLQTTDPEKTANQFKADTGHELQMVYISENVYQVTIL